MLPDSTLVSSEQMGTVSSMARSEVSAQTMLGDRTSGSELVDDEFGVDINTCSSGLPKDKLKCGVI